VDLEKSISGRAQQGKTQELRLSLESDICRSAGGYTFLS
jgi:hypothetical protein